MSSNIEGLSTRFFGAKNTSSLFLLRATCTLMPQKSHKTGTVPVSIQIPAYNVPKNTLAYIRKELVAWNMGGYEWIYGR